MKPEEIEQWQGIVRDFVILTLAAFDLTWQIVAASQPNPYLIGAGLTLLGMPPMFRADIRRRRNRREDDDPYEGPGGYYRTDE